MANSSVASAGVGFSKVRWALIAIFLLVTILSSFIVSGILNDLAPIFSVLSLFVVAVLHGKERYGWKNITVFFFLTWLVSHSFEVLGTHTGFPFGDYFYDKLVGPRLFQVPLIIMPAYFGMGYASWILANVLLGQYDKKIAGDRVFFIPLVSAFLMVMWDLCIDPTSSTVAAMWTWRAGGAYFGVPLQNYFGWFLTVFVLFQIFALYIAKYDVRDNAKAKIFTGKSFWLEMVAVYGIQSLGQLLNPLGQPDHKYIYGSMALITVFTMVFVTLLAYLKIRDSR